METISLQRSIASNSIAYHRSGSGSPVVLIHGVGLRAESWFQQIRVLQASNTVYALDMPGHGESGAIGADIPTLGCYTEAIRFAIESLVPGPAVVAGHSMGALVALDLAARFPVLCRGVAAIAAIHRRSPQARRAIGERLRSLQTDRDSDMVSAPLGRWFGEAPGGHDGAMAALCRDWLMHSERDEYIKAYSVFASEDGPGDAALASLELPALFLAGAQDLNSTPTMARAMASLAGGKAVIVDDARHLLQLTHPDHVSRTLAEFIAVCERTNATGSGGETKIEEPKRAE